MRSFIRVQIDFATFKPTNDYLVSLPQLKSKLFMNHSPSPEEWLNREDVVCHQDRLDRLHWLTEQTPNAESWSFPGGLISKFLFEEARYCFVYGQFLATIVLGLSYIEHTLAALFYASGRDDLERAGIAVLLRESLNTGLINHSEFDDLNHAREIRNPVTHFRRPLFDDTVEYRAVEQNELPYSVIEQDAFHVMTMALRLLDKNTI